jgi:hypothetical protein
MIWTHPKLLILILYDILKVVSTNAISVHKNQPIDQGLDTVFLLMCVDIAFKIMSMSIIIGEPILLSL